MDASVAKEPAIGASAARRALGLRSSEARRALAFMDTAVTTSPGATWVHVSSTKRPTLPVGAAPGMVVLRAGPAMAAARLRMDVLPNDSCFASLPKRVQSQGNGRMQEKHHGCMKETWASEVCARGS